MQNLGLLQSFKQIFTGRPCDGDPDTPERVDKSSERFSLAGNLSRGNTTKYAISGEDFRVDDETWIFGDVTLGAYVVVNGTFDIDGVRYARKITIKNQPAKSGKRTKSVVRVQR